jgi:hypothetical protein
MYHLVFLCFLGVYKIMMLLHLSDLVATVGRIGFVIKMREGSWVLALPQATKKYRRS